MKTNFYITFKLVLLLFSMSVGVASMKAQNHCFELLISFDTTSTAYIDTIKARLHATEKKISLPSKTRLWEICDSGFIATLPNGQSIQINTVGDAVAFGVKAPGNSGASSNYPIKLNPHFPSCPYGIDNQNGGSLLPYCPSLTDFITFPLSTNSIKIAVLDSGINDGSYFNSLVASGIDFTRDYPNATTNATDNHTGYGHGTRVASVIAWYLKKLAGNSKIIPIKVLNSNAQGTAFQAIQGIDAANLMNVNIINMSFIGLDPFTSLLYPNKTPMRNAIQLAEQNNILCIAAAGNENKDIDSLIINSVGLSSYKVTYPPATNDNTNSIVVGSYGCELEKSSFSNYGEISVDIFAPGENIFTIDNTGKKNYSTGTSFATPIVSGIAALIKLQNPSISLAAWRAAVLNYGKTLTALPSYSVSGAAATSFAPVLKNQLANAGPDVTIDCTTALPVMLCATPNLSYLWNTNQTTKCINVSPNKTTIYVVTITGSPDTCHIIDTVKVIHKCLTANALALKQVICNGGNDGKAEIFAQGGTLPYSYQWSNGATSKIIDGLSAGIYTCTVTDANTNTTAVSVTILENKIEEDNNISSYFEICPNDYFCFTALDPIVPQNANVTYAWSRSTYPNMLAPVVVATSSTFPCEILYNNTNTPVMYYYQRTTTSLLLGVVCTAASSIVSVQVNPVPVVTNVNYSICSNSTFNFILPDAINNVLINSYNIESININGNAVANPNNVGIGTAYTKNALIGNSYSSVLGATVMYQITPVAIDGCQGTSFLVSIIINPLPSVSIGVDITLCQNISTILTAQGNGNFLWNTGQTIQSISVTPTLTTTYSVTITDSNSCTATDNVIVTVKPCAPVVVVDAKLKAGTIDPSTMLIHTALKDLPNFPTTDPYSSLPLNAYYTHVNNLQATTISQTVLHQTGSQAIVDWVFIELRTGVLGSTTVAYTKSALLLANGKIVATDGVSAVSFPNAPSANYYIAIRHRNHIGFRTSNAIPLNSTATVLNFTNNSIPLFGITPLSPSGVMIAGDANHDGSIDACDIVVWEVQNGLFDNYLLNTDFNLDTSIDSIDAAIWEINNGSYQELN